MKWVEIISLRCSPHVDTRFLDELLKEASRSDSPTDTPHPVEIRMYHHSVFETDFSIHIYWKSEPGGGDKSPLGLRLSSALRNLGLLTHSVWFETTAADSCSAIGTPGPEDKSNGSRLKEAQRKKRSFRED
jgi:hypothetical protein